MKLMDKIMVSAYSVFKISRVHLGVRVLSFCDYGNVGGQLKTRYDDVFGEKTKGDLHHKRNILTNK